MKHVNYTTITLILIILVFVSCTIDGSFRGLYSYYKVTQKENPGFIQKPEQNLCSLPAPDSIVVYKINGHELRGCFKSQSLSLVYLWSPNCSAEVCIPPNYAQEYSNTRNVDLFVVANYYDYRKMTIDYKLNRPIFGINTEHYRTNLTDRYLKKFRNDLLDGETIDNESPRFLLFRSDSLIAFNSSIEGLNIN